MNDRELAALIWLGVALAWGLTRPDLRRSLGEVVKAALHPKLLLPLVIMAAYISGLVYAASRLELWNPNLLSDTLAWAVGTGLVLYASPSPCSCATAHSGDSSSQQWD